MVNTSLCKKINLAAASTWLVTRMWCTTEFFLNANIYHNLMLPWWRTEYGICSGIYFEFILCLQVVVFRHHFGLNWIFCTLWWTLHEPENVLWSFCFVQSFFFFTVNPDDLINYHANNKTKTEEEWVEIKVARVVCSQQTNCFLV